MSGVKNILYEGNSRLDTEEEKIGEFEDIAIETMQNETQRGKTLKEKNKQYQEICYIILISPIYMSLEAQKKYMRDRRKYLKK